MMKFLMNFCREFLVIVDNDEGVLGVLIISDEAHFNFSGYINRISGIGAITTYVDLGIEKVTVWCHVSTFSMVGPSFFGENNGTITMDSEHYCAMLQTLWAMELRRARNV
jgi:hypothetical protein